MFSSQLFALALIFTAGASALTIEARNSTIEARNSTVEARAPSLPSGWSIKSSCTTDHAKERVFSSSGKLSLQRNVLLGKNTPKACLTLCAKNGYGYAALRLGTECWCGSSSPKIRSRSKKDCDRPCSGDLKTMCGGHTASTVYQHSKLKGKKPKASTSKPKLASGWSVAASCVNDPTLGENLLQSTKVFELQNNTPFACTTLCRSKGYKLAGVEYGNECMCGKGYKNGKKPSSKSSSECNYACTGDSRLTCGAGHRVQLYK
ncbi:hypothetical protein AURDEDRAFT_179648, partial [Auricularia subglabra TFB-10046 SS5]